MMTGNKGCDWSKTFISNLFTSLPFFVLTYCSDLILTRKKLFKVTYYLYIFIHAKICINYMCSSKHKYFYFKSKVDFTLLKTHIYIQLQRKDGRLFYNLTSRILSNFYIKVINEYFCIKTGNAILFRFCICLVS